jgi:hypothetical protein
MTPMRTRARARTPAYDYINEFLRRYVAAHASVPTIEAVRTYLSAPPRNLNSSITTIRKALDIWQDSEEGRDLILTSRSRMRSLEQGVADDPSGIAFASGSGSAATVTPTSVEPEGAGVEASPGHTISPLFASWEVQIREALRREVSAHYAAQAKEATDKAALERDTALATSARSVERAEQLRLHAEAKSEREVNEARATVTAMQASFERLAAAHSLALANVESEAHAAAHISAQKEVALVTAAALERETALKAQRAMLAQVVEDRGALVDARVADIAALKTEMLGREARAAEQYSGLNRVLGQQVSDLKTKVSDLEKALLAERKRADGAEGSLVRQAVEQVSAVLKTHGDRAEVAVVTVEALVKAALNDVRAIADTAKTVASQEAATVATTLLESALAKFDPNRSPTR